MYKTQIKILLKQILFDISYKRLLYYYLLSKILSFSILYSLKIHILIFLLQKNYFIFY